MSADTAPVGPEAALSTGTAATPPAELAPIELEPESRFSSEALQAAREIQDAKRGDTLGAATRLHRNLGRNALVVSSTVAAAYETTLNDVMINAIPTGVVYEGAAGIVVGGAIYVGGKWQERRKIAKTEVREERIREELGEPVDLLGVYDGGNRRKHRTTVLRWYGYDEAFVTGVSGEDNGQAKVKDTKTDTATDSTGKDAAGPAAKVAMPSLGTAVRSFETVVAFAKEAGIKEVAAGARLLDSIPKEKHQDFGKIVQNDTLTRQKRVHVTDLAADKEVIRCDIKTAEALIAEIKQKTEMNALAAVASLLEEARPNHPFIAHARTLMDKGYNEATLREAKTVLRTKLEQTSGNGTTLIKQTGRDGEMTVDREYTYARLNGDAMDLVGVMQSRDGANQDARYKGRESLLQHLGFETVDELIRDTQERRHVLAPNVLQQRAEAAAWLILRDPATAFHDARPITTETAQSSETPRTLLQRLPHEQQRSTLPILRKRGKVPKDEQTIEYNPARPTRFSRLKRGVGTVVLLATTSGAAMTAGSFANDGLNNLGRYLEQQYALEQGYTDGRIPYDREDDYHRYREKDSGFLTNLSQAFNNAAEFDGNISDAMAPYVVPLMPAGLGEGLLPYADPTWVSEKQKALEDLNNAYSDGKDRSGVGDVSTNKNGAAWTLTPNGDASTEGYWPQSVQSHINTHDGIGGANWTPPYRAFGIQYEPNSEEYLMQAAYESDYARFIDLKDPSKIGAEDTYIKVEGKKVLDDANMSNVAVPNEELGYGYSDLVYGYSLPVLLGSDVIAATAERYSIKDNRPLGKQEFRVIQIPSGAFYLLPTAPEFGYDVEPSYLDITYWLDPNATTARPVRADMPFTLPDEIGYERSMPFGKGYSEQQALQVWRTLSGNPNATELPSAEEAAAVIQREKGYSFTPYQDNGVKLTEDEPANVGEGLSTVGTVAADLPDLNCNETATVEVLASMGRTEDGGFTNTSTGYNNNGDNVLKTGEAHMVLITNKEKDNIIDGTPSGGSLPEGEGEGFDPNMNPADSVLDTVRTGAEVLAALALATYGFRNGRRYVPKSIEMTNNYLNTRAASKLHPTVREVKKIKQANPDAPLNPEQEEAKKQRVEAEKQRVETEKRRLHDLVSILQWMQHSPEGAQLDEQALPRYFTDSYANDLASRYNGLPPELSAKHVRAITKALENDGRLQLSKETKQALNSFARSHVRHQAQQLERIEQS